MTLLECTTESENETILVGDRRKIISFAVSIAWDGQIWWAVYNTASLHEWY